MRHDRPDDIRTHYRIPYLRASFQGGDTQSPLCQASLMGYAGTAQAAYSMTDIAAHVDCTRCRRWLSLGGLRARREWLVMLLNKDNPPTLRRVA